MAVFLALVVISITLLFGYLKYMQGYWRRRGIPHDKPHFPTGNLKGWQTEKHMIELFDPIYKKYKGQGPFAGFYFFTKPAVVATDLEFVKNVLIKDFNNFDYRGIFHNERDDPLTANLFQTDAEKWRPLRHKLSPTFTSGKMKIMYPTVLNVGNEFLQVFGEKVAAADGGVLELTDLLARFTADVIGTCAFGIECNSLRNPNAEFCVIGRRALLEKKHSKIVDNFIDAFPDLARKLRMEQTHPAITEFYNRIVKDTIDYREKNNIKRSDFMNILIELKNTAGSLSFNDVVAQAFVFFIAGFETSSTTMGFALLELARNVAIQDKLRQHVDEVFKRHNDELSYECLQDMRYLEQVISETLRMYAILPTLTRKANNHYKTSDPKFFIEKGTMVIIPVNAIHYDPDLYPEPHKFDPDRFTDEEIKNRPSCSWLPFGDGPRNCIGMRFGKMQTALGLAYLIRNFRFSVCEETKLPVDFIKHNILLSLNGGLHLKVEKV